MELQIAFQNADFMPTEQVFTLFFHSCGRGGLRTATCLKTAAWSKKGHAPSETRLLQQIFFCASQISWRS